MESTTEMQSILAQNEALKAELQTALNQFKWAADKLADAQHELAVVKMMLVKEIEGRGKN